MKTSGFPASAPWTVLLLLLTALLFGCQQPIYTDLSERDANTMMSALLKRGIYATKADEGKGRFTLKVDDSQVVGSLEILRRQNLPPEKFASLGSVFPKEGMMSSPLEEEARLGFAIAQELAGTYSKLDGVLGARVHVVMQEQDPVTEAVTEAKASVFIRYLPGSKVEQYIPHMRHLATNAVPNLKYDNTFVFLFPSTDTIIMPPPPEYKQLFGVDMAPYAARNFLVTLATFLITGMGIGAASLFLFNKYRERKTAQDTEEKTDG